MSTVTLERRIPLGTDLPNICTNPDHSICYTCCDHTGYRHRVVDAWPGVTNPRKLIVQCEGCGANGEVDGAEIGRYVQ